MAGWMGGGLRRGLIALSESTFRTTTFVRHNSKACKPNLVIQLKQTYPGLGFEGDFASVRPGFARNFLVPQGYARLLDHFERKTWLATKEAEGEIQQMVTADATMKATLANLPRVLERLNTHTLIVRGLPGPSGLKRPVTATDIVTQLAKQYKVTLSEESVELASPLNKFGEHLVPLYIDPEHSQAQNRLKVHVVDARTKKKDLPATKPKPKDEEDFAFDDDEEDYYEVYVDRRAGKPPSAIPTAH